LCDLKLMLRGFMPYLAVEERGRGAIDLARPKEGALKARNDIS
jgi:hypothetical protein